MVNSNGWPAAVGCWPMWPAATCRFCSRRALATSAAVRFSAASRSGSTQTPHAVVLLAELLAVADAVHAGDLVLDLDGGEVAQVELVVAAVGRVDGDDLQDVRVALAGGDAGLLDHVGQQRQGQVDAVLHQHLGEVQVDAGLEGDGQGVASRRCSTATPCTSCLRRR